MEKITKSRRPEVNIHHNDRQNLCIICIMHDYFIELSIEIYIFQSRNYKPHNIDMPIIICKHRNIHEITHFAAKILLNMISIPGNVILFLSPVIPADAINAKGIENTKSFLDKHFFLGVTISRTAVGVIAVIVC